jgi:glycosyltransferase involved in cell wall biosynthesis
MRVAIECDNLSLSAGTGIATHAVALADALAGLGHTPVGVFGVKAGIGGKSRFLDEVHLYDARLELRRPVRDFMRRAYYWVAGDLTGARAQQIHLSGEVHQAPGPLSSCGFTANYGIPHLRLRADMHFNRYKNIMPIKAVAGVGALHTTQPIAIRIKGIPNLQTLHDIIPLRLPYATLDNKRQYFDLLTKLINKSDRIVTVSEFSRKDILSVFKGAEDRVINTWQSVTLPKAAMSLSEEQVAQVLANAFGLSFRNYYLFVGAIEPKKNVSRLIAGYAASGTTRPLILAGGYGWQHERDENAIKDERFLHYRQIDGLIRSERSVRHLNYVSRHNLVLLLRGARALVFPSLYEGFGLPVLEAMLAGTPVITSNVSSLPEVAGEAAEYVNPFEEYSISNAIRKLDNDDERCRELTELGTSRASFFSPKRYRERLAELYRPLV